MRKFDTEDNIRRFLGYLEATSEWHKLNYKTQVFNDRANDNVKSRGSHCLDVGRIAEDLTKQLGGDSTASAKARLIGFIHDLGHIPFGHAGESVADSLIKNYPFSESEIEQVKEVRKLLFGDEYASKNPGLCFEHNENSVLQYITMCKRFGYEPDQEIIIGILAHSTSRYQELPQTLSQQAVRLADKLAYINYDVNDLLESFRGKEEFAAVEELYKPPLLDPSGNEIKISYKGKEYTLYEFVMELSPADKIASFVDAAIEDAKKQAETKKDEYADYETVLTGCNDIVVEMARLRKAVKKANKEGNQQEVKKCYDRIDELKRELYRRSPILYAAYEIKDRSDDFIRTGKGLTKDLQVDRTSNNLSAVGNKDLMNEYIYKSLVLFLRSELEKNASLSKEQVVEKYKAANFPQSFIDLYTEYLDFRNEQNSVILSLTGNNGVVYPEIYTVINFIGVHSNDDLIELAKVGGLIKQYEETVLPAVKDLLNNPELYDSEKGIFTKAGIERRNELIDQYGARIKVEFGLEEESITPMAADDTIERTKQAGYSVEDYTPRPKTSSLEQFKQEAAKEESKYVASEVERLSKKSENIEQIDEIIEEVGRKI